MGLALYPQLAPKLSRKHAQLPTPTLKMMAQALLLARLAPITILSSALHHNSLYTCDDDTQSQQPHC